MKLRYFALEGPGGIYIDVDRVLTIKELPYESGPRWVVYSELLLDTGDPVMVEGHAEAIARVVDSGWGDADVACAPNRNRE